MIFEYQIIQYTEKKIKRFFFFLVIIQSSLEKKTIVSTAAISCSANIVIKRWDYRLMRINILITLFGI